jgi:hydroxyacylglutathione hydrolase
MQIRVFTFNPFYENTYILFDDSKECVIIDPGCWNKEERDQLIDFVEKNDLKPVRLLNTHCHIDHIFGNTFISDKYSLPLEANKIEAENLSSADVSSAIFGVPAPKSPMIEKYLNEGDTVEFGSTSLKVLFCPGHSAGHIVFYNEEEKTVIGGDVLFRESIGRTDLPGGDFDILRRSIKEKLFTLPDDVIVFPGHGPETTIGYEKQHNPFINGELTTNNR